MFISFFYVRVFSCQCCYYSFRYAIIDMTIGLIEMTKILHRKVFITNILKNQNDWTPFPMIMHVLTTVGSDQFNICLRFLQLNFCESAKLSTFYIMRHTEDSRSLILFSLFNYVHLIFFCESVQLSLLLPIVQVCHYSTWLLGWLKWQKYCTEKSLLPTYWKVRTIEQHFLWLCVS